MSAAGSEAPCSTIGSGFSTIADLNDPFEGKPSMVAAHADPEQQREAVRNLMIREWMAVHNVDRATALQSIEQRYLSAADGFNAESFQSKLEEIINRMLWVYCVAGTRDLHPDVVTLRGWAQRASAALQTKCDALRRSIEGDLS